MKATGIIRRMDALGRIVIPKEIRKVQAIKTDDPFEIYVADNGIFIKKYTADKCIFCGKPSAESFMGENICLVCIDKLSKQEGVENRETDNGNHG